MKSIPYRLIALLGALAFAVTLAIVVGQRMSTEAMAVLTGVVAGVGASIPTSLIVVWIATQSLAKQWPVHAPAPRRESPTQDDLPPRIVVVQQPAPAQAYPQPQANWTTTPYLAGAYPNMPAPRSPRKFTIIGGTNEPEGLPTLQLVESEI